MQNGRSFNPPMNPHHLPPPSHQIQRFPSQFPPHYPPIDTTFNPPPSSHFQPSNLSITPHHPPHSHGYGSYSDYELRLRDEVIYLHSLWHQGPPSSSNPYLEQQPSPSFHHFKKPRLLQPQQPPSSDKEWPIDTKPTSPSPQETGWGEFKPRKTPTFLPTSAEEQARVLAVRLHLKGLDSCNGLFRKNESDDDEDDDEEDDDDGDYDDEEFDFFVKVFEDNRELRGYYEKKWENGEFYCLVCGVIGNKLGRKYKNVVALVQHSVSISKTKKRKAHRAYGHVICKVLGWDIRQLPSLPLSVGDASCLSLEKSNELQVEVKDQAHACADTTAVVETGDSANTSNSQAGVNDVPDAVKKNNAGSTNEGCTSSELTHSESERKVCSDDCEEDDREGFKEDRVCTDAENPQLEQEDNPQTVHEEVVNKIGEGCSALVSESIDCGGNDASKHLKTVE